jgi:uncharacterized protein YdaU (DUF1376 family)
VSKTDTWMPLYIADYLGDTMHLNGAQHGAYLLLLMHHWRNGPLPDDEAQLSAIARFDAGVWRKSIAPVVLKFFDKTADGLVQKRLMAEREFASELTDKRAIAGAAGAAKRWGKDRKKVAGGNGGPNGNGYDKDNGKSIANAMANGIANASQLDGPIPSPSQLPRKEDSSLRSLGDCASDFDLWWSAYPRKVGKGHAAKAYAAALRKAPAAKLLSALQGYQFDSREKYIPHPATWLNGERWLDEQDTFDPVLRAAGLSPDDFNLSEFIPIGPPT